MWKTPTLHLVVQVCHREGPCGGELAKLAAAAGGIGRQQVALCCRCGGGGGARRPGGGGGARVRGGHAAQGVG